MGTERASATPGVVQNSPIWTPGVAKDADSPATARSQVATSWHPAAVARPCTCAMTGLGSSRMASITSVHSANTSVYDASSRSISSRRSWPELNTGPSERSTTTRTASSRSNSPNRSLSSSRVSVESAFRRDGLFSVSVTTPSRDLRRTI